jgi:hypothetical protein
MGNCKLIGQVHLRYLKLARRSVSQRWAIFLVVVVKGSLQSPNCQRSRRRLRRLSGAPPRRKCKLQRRSGLHSNSSSGLTSLGCHILQGNILQGIIPRDTILQGSIPQDNILQGNTLQGKPFLLNSHGKWGHNLRLPRRCRQPPRKARKVWILMGKLNTTSRCSQEHHSSNRLKVCPSARNLLTSEQSSWLSSTKLRKRKRPRIKWRHQCPVQVIRLQTRQLISMLHSRVRQAMALLQVGTIIPILPLPNLNKGLTRLLKPLGF